MFLTWSHFPINFYSCTFMHVCLKQSCIHAEYMNNKPYKKSYFIGSWYHHTVFAVYICGSCCSIFMRSFRPFSDCRKCTLHKPNGLIQKLKLIHWLKKICYNFGFWFGSCEVWRLSQSQPTLHSCYFWLRIASLVGARSFTWEERLHDKPKEHLRGMLGWARWEKWMSQPKLDLLFWIDSDAKLHMNLTYQIRFGSCEVRHLSWVFF